MAAKEKLCVRAEALLEQDDVDAALTAYRELQREWHQVGALPRKVSKPMWRRFQTVRETLTKRRREAQAKADAENIAQREQICGELEAQNAVQADSSAQDRVAAVVKLREQWLGLASIRSAAAKALDERFTTTLAAFIKAHGEDLADTELDPKVAASRRVRLVERFENLWRG